MVFIHGECGVGKTHLLQAACQRHLDLNPSHAVRYTTGEQFTNEFLAAMRAAALDEFRARIRKLDLLAIDDIHFLASKTATQSEFLHTLDAIDFSGARVLLASDEHPRLIKRFSQSLVSRFLSGMVVRIDAPDRSTRLSLIRRLAATRSLPLSPAAEEMIVSRCMGSVRELEGASRNSRPFTRSLHHNHLTPSASCWSNSSCATTVPDQRSRFESPTSSVP